MKSVEKSVLAGALAAALGGGPALAQNVPGSQLTTTTPGRDAPIASSMRSGTSLARVDASFIKNAAESDATEIAASRLALQRSNNEQVKQFAQQMVTEHGRTSDALTALAQKKGVVVSTDPSLIDKGKLKLLAALDGVSFDKRYASSVGVSAHESAVKLFQKEAGSGKDGEVKAFASTTLPALQKHLSMAQALSTSVDSGGSRKSDQ